jgi:hypothetical protein
MAFTMSNTPHIQLLLAGLRHSFMLLYALRLQALDGPSFLGGFRALKKSGRLPRYTQKRQKLLI